MIFYSCERKVLRRAVLTSHHFLLIEHGFPLSSTTRSNSFSPFDSRHRFLDTQHILVLIPAHHQRRKERGGRRCDCYSNPLGSLMGKSEWEWGIRGLWRPIYSVISQLTVLAMAGLPESLLKTWQGLHVTDSLRGAVEEGVRRMQEREEMERKRRAM